MRILEVPRHAPDGLRQKTSAGIRAEHDVPSRGRRSMD